VHIQKEGASKQARGRIDDDLSATVVSHAPLVGRAAAAGRRRKWRARFLGKGKMQIFETRLCIQPVKVDSFRLPFNSLMATLGFDFSIQRQPASIIRSLICILKDGKRA
jgi:hypothetical protein